MMLRAGTLCALTWMSAIGCGAPSAAPSDRVGLTVDQVVSDAGQYAGDRVTLRGELVDVWTSRVFTIGDASLLENNRKLLIVSRTPVPPLGVGEAAPSLLPNATVQVTGVVRVDGIADIERDVGLSLNLAVKQLWRPQLPVVVADEVLIVPRKVP